MVSEAMLPRAAVREVEQRLTVFEPDDSMIEVAIAAVTPVLPEDPEDGRW